MQASRVDIQSEGRRPKPRGGVVHTDRDQEIVRWIGGLGAAGAERVIERFAITRTRAYARLGKLTQAGLLELRPLLHGQPGLYVATAEGLRWQGLQRLGVYRVSPGGFVHAREVAAAAVALERGFPDRPLLSERQIRLQERDVGRPVASAKLAELPTGRAFLHRPDLALVSPVEPAIAVEVELTPKAPKRLEEICRAWARACHVEAVYYLAAPAPARALERAIARVRAGDRITVIALEDVRRGSWLELEEPADVRV
jgi:hypothetical protein